MLSHPLIVDLASILGIHFLFFNCIFLFSIFFHIVDRRQFLQYLWSTISNKETGFVIFLTPKFFIQPFFLPAFKYNNGIQFMINIFIQLLFQLHKLYFCDISLKNRILYMGQIPFTNLKNMIPSFLSIVFFIYVIYQYYIHISPPYSESFIFFFPNQMLDQLV